MRWLHRGTNTVRELFAIYLGLLLLAALGYMAAEGTSFRDSIWWAVVTATTTGYGDIAPKTDAGRIVAVLLMHLALFFVIPLIVVRLTQHLLDDRDAFTHDEQEALKAQQAELHALLLEVRARLAEDDAARKRVSS